MTPELSVTMYDGTAGVDALDEAVDLYRAVYVEPPYLEGEDDFANFAADLPKRAEVESFRLAVSRLDGRPVGFAMGHRLPVSTNWWQGAVTPFPADVTTEHPGRTFAIIELAVRGPLRQRGLGRRLHAHLTADLREERRTLLVRPEALAAVRAYSRWGYVQVGQIQPFPGGPTYLAMVA